MTYRNIKIQAIQVYTLNFVVGRRSHCLFRRPLSSRWGGGLRPLKNFFAASLRKYSWKWWCCPWGWPGRCRCRGGRSTRCSFGPPGARRTCLCSTPPSTHSTRSRHTVGFMKRVYSVYTLYIFTIYLSPCKQSAERMLSRKPSVVYK